MLLPVPIEDVLEVSAELQSDAELKAVDEGSRFDTEAAEFQNYMTLEKFQQMNYLTFKKN